MAKVKPKKPKKTLTASIFLNKELAEDKGLDVSMFISELFKEGIMRELEKKKRRISNAKKAIELIVKVKTAKL